MRRGQFWNRRCPPTVVPPLLDATTAKSSTASSGSCGSAGRGVTCPSATAPGGRCMRGWCAGERMERGTACSPRSRPNRMRLGRQLGGQQCWECGSGASACRGSPKKGSRRHPTGRSGAAGRVDNQALSGLRRRWPSTGGGADAFGSGTSAPSSTRCSTRSGCRAWIT